MVRRKCDAARMPYNPSKKPYNPLVEVRIITSRSYDAALIRGDFRLQLPIPVAVEVTTGYDDCNRPAPVIVPKATPVEASPKPAPVKAKHAPFIVPKATPVEASPKPAPVKAKHAPVIVPKATPVEASPIIVPKATPVEASLDPVVIPKATPVEASPDDDAFLPLSTEEETKLRRVLSENDSKILVLHKNSNIGISGEKLSCLKPREWLNDEVINLYIILLKERELREPSKHLKCHFFSTFFFPKLVNSKSGYNYESVRKWTDFKHLGYHLKDCEKIFVPIPQHLHWTLVIINIQDHKFQFLDSFKSYSRACKIIEVVARYFVDEVKDKNAVDIDVSPWTQEFVQDLPVQTNGSDCGMFMLKYMDFHSRGVGLCFNQEDMPYFRLRTAKEILKLKAD